MPIEPVNSRIAFIGGGPAALFLLKEMLDNNLPACHLTIFESSTEIGKGMPYSKQGARAEHVTNVSANELPKLIPALEEWLQILPAKTLDDYQISPEQFSVYEVLPRLLLGDYLQDQFNIQVKRANEKGFKIDILLDTWVDDITDDVDGRVLHVSSGKQQFDSFNAVVICTGHRWLEKKEKSISGYFDSPYPPEKLNKRFNHRVALKGSSLTAIDALKTVCRANGKFISEGKHKLKFIPDAASPNFKLVMYSRDGLLPAIRFHLVDPHLENPWALTEEEILEHMVGNEGFLSINFLFEQNFKRALSQRDPAFYETIKDLDIEGFVDKMMSMREDKDAFELFRQEYREAEKSIQQHWSIHWKELLGSLSFAMNYPAKHFSAEDMQRLQKVLMPLISLVIAYVPQSSCEELLAVYEAGMLELVNAGDDNEIDTSDGSIHFKYKNEKGSSVNEVFGTFIDCTGQKHFSYEQFPFQGLVSAGAVSPALLKFQSAEVAKKQYPDEKGLLIKKDEDHYYLQVSGIAITDNFQVIDKNGKPNDRLFIVAVPYIGGYNPDYSGLDFCEAAGEKVVEALTR